VSRDAIVSDGHRRLRSSPEFKAECARIESEVRAEYDSLIDHGGGLDRWRFRIMRELEVRRRVRAIDPHARGANWLHR